MSNKSRNSSKKDSNRGDCRRRSANGNPIATKSLWHEFCIQQNLLTRIRLKRRNCYIKSNRTILCVDHKPSLFLFDNLWWNYAKSNYIYRTFHLFVTPYLQMILLVFPVSHCKLLTKCTNITCFETVSRF